MDEVPTTREGPLVVSSKVLGHISEGLYRGPAGVIKELISNAYDANAKTVWISTGRPQFDVVSVRDDGDGMPLDKFVALMSGGIGDSDKRASQEPLINGRKTIGRLGIGILGISQISHEFSIVSHSRVTRSAFEATVWMRDFRSEILDSGVSGPGPDDESSEGIRGFQVGGYEATEIPYEPDDAGLTITATDPTEGFRRQMSEDDPAPLPKSFSDFAEWALKKDNLATGPWYNQMVWQIASLSPVQYLPDNRVVAGDRTMTKIAQAIEDFEFDVVIDGVKLYKPVVARGHAIQVASSTVGEGEGSFHFPLEFDSQVWGAPLQIKGYIHASGGAVLHPDDLRGLLIRLKHIGIGGYDKSLLGYRYAEGPRFGWLTGELFVDEGLEDALTVGRDGFDAGHPHYIALRQWIHEELRFRVFPTLYRGISSRREIRETKRLSTRSQAFEEAISEFTGHRIVIDRVHEPDSPPVHVDPRNGIAIINESSDWPRGKRQREAAQNLCLIFELVRVTNATDRSGLDDFKGLTVKFLSMR